MTYDLSRCGHCANRIERSAGVWAMWLEGSKINDNYVCRISEVGCRGSIFDHLMYDYYWFSTQPYDFGGEKAERLLELKATGKACGVRLYSITPGSHAEGTMCLLFIIENLDLFKATIVSALDRHTRRDSFARLGDAAQVSFDKGGVRRSLNRSYSSIPSAESILEVAVEKLWPKGVPEKLKLKGAD